MKNNNIFRVGIILLLLLLVNPLQSQTTNFTTVGINTYTVPACVYSINVTCIGGGGAGRGTTGGGGGAGGVTATKLISVTPGQTYTLVVGGGGTGVSGGSGNPGDNSTFGGTLVVAEGGKGATSTTGAVATTTVNSVGDILSSGGAGGASNTAGSSGTGLSASGGGGGGANGGTAGAGGAVVGSGGAGGAGGANGAAGANGGVPGGGGGGAGGNFKGGDGGQGVVIVSATPSSTSVNSATICSGQIATLNATLGDSYIWSTNETTSSINVSPTTNTSYTVTGTGTCSGTAVSNVTVYQPVTVSSSTICTGNSTTLYAGGAASYSWSTGATTSSITTPTLTTLGVTSYTVTSNNCGIISTAYANVIVRNCISTPITSTTVTTWTAPSCVYSVDVEVWSAGGGAGAENATNGGTGGGGGGAYSKSTLTVTPNTIYTLHVGKGGAGAAPNSGNSPGSPGEDSWFSLTGSTPTSNTTGVLAKGGGGGAGGTASAGGIGGSSAGGYGTVKYSGGNGGKGVGNTANAKNDLLGGGGGSSAGPGGNGINGADATHASGGVGGDGTLVGGGSGGDGSSVNTVAKGDPGVAPGGGGGGSTDGTGGGSPFPNADGGANGGNGQIVLTYELSTPAVTVTPGAEICPGTNATLTATGASTYTWTPGAGLSPTTGATVVATPTITTTYTVTGAKPGCTVTATAKSVVTFTTCCIPATVSLTSAVGTNAQTVCINAPITTITYTIGGGGLGASVNGLPTGITGTYSGGIFTMNGSLSALGTYNYTVVTSGGCAPVTTTGTIVVTSNANITLTSAVGTNAQNLCVNTPITNITYTISGGGTGATVSGLPAGVSGNYTSGIYTISGTPPTTGTFNYTVTTTGICTQTLAVGAITVNPYPVLSISDITICVGTVGSITAGGANSYSWSSSSTTYTVSPANVITDGPASTTTYSLTGTTLGCSSYTTVVMNVQSSLSVGFTSTVICINNSAILTATGATSYTWTPGGATTNTISVSPLTTSPYTVSGTMGTCSGSGTGTVTVNPDAAIALTSAVGTTTQTLCINTPLTDITYTVSGGATGAYVTGLPAGLTGTYSSGTVTISGIPTVIGTFGYTVNTTGSCAQTSTTGTIVGNPNTVVDLTSGTGSTAQTLCLTDVLTTITYSLSGGATNATVTGLPTGVTGGYAANVVTISGTPTTLGSYNYTLTTAGGCAPVNVFGSIVINPNAAIGLTSLSATTTQTLCLTDVLVPITYTVSGGGTNATVTGLPNGLTGDYSGGVVTISGTPTALGTHNYTVTTVGSCTQTSVTGIIIINPNAAIGLTSLPATTTQTLCLTDALVPITYTVSGGGTNANVTGLPSGVIGGYTNGVVTISGTPTALGTYNYTVTTAGSCTQTSVTGIIIINPNAAIGLTSLPATTTQTLCLTDALVPITYTVSGGGTNATVTGLPNGLTGDYSGGVVTISGTPTALGTHNYTVTTVGSCTQTSVTGIIIINPNAAIGLTSPTATTSQTLCLTDAISTITYTVSGGGTNATVTGLPNGLTGDYSSGVVTISGTPTVLGTYGYTVATLGTCTQTSVTGVIVINPNAAIGLISGNNIQSGCVNNAIVPITYTISGGGTGATITTLPAGITSSFTAGVFTISGTPTTISSQTEVRTYTLTTVGSCTQTALTGTITVYPDAVIALISATGTDAQTKCINTAITTITYSVSGGATGASIISGAFPTGIYGSFAANVFTVSGTSTATGSFNYTVATSGTCNQKDATGIITVNPLPAATINQDEDICRDSIAKDLVLKGSNGTPPYIFAFKKNNDPNTTLIIGNNTAVITPLTDKTGAITYALVSVTDNNGCSQAQSGTATVTVHENPHAIFTISPERISILEPEITITDASIAATEWMWDFGDGNFSSSPKPQTHTYADTGTYKIKLLLSNKGCKDSTSEIVRIILPLSLYVPNTFTPNNDGFNDVFKVEGDGISKFEMMIYDRWGQLIFHADDISKGWDGRANGGREVAQMDTYIYVVNLRALANKHDYIYRGVINLIK